MSYQIVAMILIRLWITASEEGTHILQNPPELWLHSGNLAQLDCIISKGQSSVIWYREQSGNLQWIYKSSQNTAYNEKYLSKANSTANQFSLWISNLQRNDSGVYYCGLSDSVHLQPNLGNGTRLIVTDASEPRLSILVPSVLEDTELPPIIPLLCLISDFTPFWKAVLWDTGEGASEALMDAGAIDGKGIFSIWSLVTIPSDLWNQERNCTCIATDGSTGRHINATESLNTGASSGSAERRDAGDCMIVLYAGLPCIFILLLIQLFILLWRKSPMRAERASQTGNQIPMRQMTQTEYATVTYTKRNAPL